MTLRNGMLVAALLAASLAVNGDDAGSGRAGAERAGSERKTRVRLGGISIGAGFSHVSGSGSYAYPYRHPYAWGYHPLWWDPFWWPAAPFYHPGLFTEFPRGEDKGEIKLAVEPKQAEVFLDGAFAGAADGLKNFWLAPGAYDLAIKLPDRSPFEKRIYVLTGKTLRISATLAPTQPAPLTGVRP